MAKEIIQGKTASLYLGSILIGCSQSIKVTVKTKKLDTVCQGSGDVETGKPGMKNITFSITGLWKQYDSTEETTNVSANDFYDGIIADTQITVVFKGTVEGDTIYTIVGYAESVDLEGTVNEIGKYSVSGWGNSIAKTAVPAP